MSGKSYFNQNVPEMVIKSLFNKYDVDESGRLQKAEAMTLLQADLGFDEKRAETYFMFMDKDGSGGISFGEFVQWLRSEEHFQNVDNASRYYKVRKAVELFKQYDADGSGTIEGPEFKKLMNSCGYEGKIGDAMKVLDKNGDGKISFPEFLAWLNWV